MTLTAIFAAGLLLCTIELNSRSLEDDEIWTFSNGFFMLSGKLIPLSADNIHSGAPVITLFQLMPKTAFINLKKMLNNANESFSLNYFLIRDIQQHGSYFLYNSAAFIIPRPDENISFYRQFKIDSGNKVNFYIMQ